MDTKTILQQIEYYRYIQENAKKQDQEWLNKYNSLNEERWYESSEYSLKQLVHKGVIPVLYSKKLKEIVKSYQLMNNQ